MNINGIEDLTVDQINYELERGAKFIVYQYCISIFIMTFKRSSEIYFRRAEENGFVKGLGYTILTLVLGWWGIPWGPIYTISSVYNNCRGGKDITQEVLRVINSSEEKCQSVS